MTRTRKASAPRPSKPGQDSKAAPERAAADTAIPDASGAEAMPEGAAAPSGGAEAKAPAAKGAGAADPAGTGAAPAAAPEESRGQADAASADRKDAAEEGKQPGATAQPPVAGDVPVRAQIEALFAAVDRGFDAAVQVTGPRKGRRRAGRQFGAEPVIIPLAALDREQLEAIDADPSLSWAIVGEPV